MFVPGKPFQPSLIIAGKAGAYPRVEHLKLRTEKKFYSIGYQEEPICKGTRLYNRVARG